MIYIKFCSIKLGKYYDFTAKQTKIRKKDLRLLYHLNKKILEEKLCESILYLIVKLNIPL